MAGDEKTGIGVEIGQRTDQVIETSDDVMVLGQEIEKEFNDLEEIVKLSQQKGMVTGFGAALSAAFQKYRAEEMETGTKLVKDTSDRVFGTQQAVKAFSEGKIE